jgi:hypothetical protein
LSGWNAHLAIELSDIGNAPKIGPLSMDLGRLENWARKLPGKCRAKKLTNYLANVFDWAANYDYCARNPARKAYWL